MANNAYKNGMIAALQRAGECTDIVVQVGSSNYYARLSKAEALDLVTTVGQSLKLIHREGEIEITGIKD